MADYPRFTPSEAALAFPPEDPRRWLRDDERRVYEGAILPDVEVSIEIEVKLKEHQGLKRVPKTRTPEQEAREAAADAQLPGVRQAHAAAVMARVLTRLAQERCWRARENGTWSPSTTSDIATPSQAPDAAGELAAE